MQDQDIEIGLAVQLPHNPEAEAAVVGGLLLSEGQALADIGNLKPSDFWNTTNRSLFKIIKMMAPDKRIDLVTLHDTLDGHYGAGSLGSKSLITSAAEMIDATPGYHNIAAYAAIVRRLSGDRDLMKMCDDVQTAIKRGDQGGVIAAQRKVADWQSTVEEMKGWTAAELLGLDVPDPEFVVDKLLAKGWLSMITSQPGAGKSTLGRDLIMCIMERGSSFLGRRVEYGSAIFCGLDEPPGLIKASFRRMGLQPDHPLTVIGREHWRDNALLALRQKAREERPAIIVIDTIGHAARIKKNDDYAEVRPAVAELRDIAEASGAHVCYLHHDNKAGGNAIGSQAYMGGVDVAIKMEGEGDQDRTAKTVKTREGIDSINVVLTQDETTGRCSVLGSVVGIRKMTMRDNILAYVLANDGVHQKQIEDNVEGRSADIRKELDSLEHDKLIDLERVGRVKKFRASQRPPLGWENGTLGN